MQWILYSMSRVHFWEFVCCVVLYLIELFSNRWPVAWPKHVANPDTHFNTTQVLLFDTFWFTIVTTRNEMDHR
jgi:hypothetical protein